jgi:hypothetical protein
MLNFHPNFGIIGQKPYNLISDVFNTLSSCYYPDLLIFIFTKHDKRLKCIKIVYKFHLFLTKQHILAINGTF